MLGIGVEILRERSHSFSYNVEKNRIEFFNIGLGDEFKLVTDLLGNPKNSTKLKTKEKHSFYLLDHSTFSSIAATISTKKDTIISIKYEYQLDDERRVIQKGLQQFTGEVYRLNEDPDNDAFVFRCTNGIDLVETYLFSSEIETRVQYVLQQNNNEIKLNKLLDSKFTLSSMDTYLQTP
ncbi:hypothetical protein [Bacillus suaedaesalsae]|uniref:Uncharacterized protein n=1 Tax=Bacillus suaedaesalsae TaxID=2810349 RepID=A0ABS2DNQ3_9BACI|nr:hypothetical protein [Bacillus suaedaesalsae]MBM6619196.1 hypothetical protein [Bacillus suaedaesalsae]